MTLAAHLSLFGCPNKVHPVRLAPMDPTRLMVASAAAVTSAKLAPEAAAAPAALRTNTEPAMPRRPTAALYLIAQSSAVRCQPGNGALVGQGTAGSPPCIQAEAAQGTWPPSCGPATTTVCMSSPSALARSAAAPKFSRSPV